jgi:hypothetical protein
MHFLHTAELKQIYKHTCNLFYQKYKIKNVFSPITNAILGQMLLPNMKVVVVVVNNYPGNYRM